MIMIIDIPNSWKRARSRKPYNPRPRRKSVLTHGTRVALAGRAKRVKVTLPQVRQ